MYLSLGNDTGYHMAQAFNKGLTKENGWGAEHLKIFKSLKSQSQLNILLNRMEEEGFLISMKSSAGRRHRYFRLNPAILCDPDGSKEYYCKPNAHGAKCEHDEDRVLSIPEDQINELLRELERENRESYFQRWSKITSFDFPTFLLFLKDLAKENDKLQLAHKLGLYHGELLKSHSRFAEIYNEFA